jgi:NAD(P)-dependent dehydrogenase (short-subunit alcohol dehydrogenase family)
MVFALEDSTAIVTGSAAGVGRSLAGALARAGAAVTICDTRPAVEQAAAVKAICVGVPSDDDRPRLPVRTCGQRPGRRKNSLDILGVGIVSALLAMRVPSVHDPGLQT